MNLTETTSLDLVSTVDLLSEIDKRADRVLVIMETDSINQTGMDWMFHHNGGFVTKERIIFSLMCNVKNLVSECLGGSENDS